MTYPLASKCHSGTTGPIDNEACERAAEILRAGGLVALPTETVYGLAADATSPDAVARIFKVKGRPQFNPLICHVDGSAMAARLVMQPPLATRLIQAFWPGPLTLVLERRPDAPITDAVSAGLTSLAVRAPAHPLMRAVIKAVGRPLAAPSANRSGRVSPTTAQHVKDDLGDDIDMIVDGGPCSVGLESTVVAVTDDRIILLRPGAITADDIERVTGLTPQKPTDGTVSSPGQLAGHYAPHARVRLNATQKGQDDVLIGFGAIAGDLTLSATGDLNEAAARLFATLRKADTLARTRKTANDSGSIAIAPVPDHGLGLAINDRLRRAAAPKNIALENRADHGSGTRI